ncbi:MAG: hypothetical protein AB7F79_01890 [Steroidobacteraceae bacterium]
MVRSLTLSLAIATLLCSGTQTPVWALNRSTLHIAQLSAAEWQAQQITIQVDLGSSSPRATINIKKLLLTGNPQPISNVQIICPQVELLAESFACAQAQVSGVFPYVGQQQFIAATRYGRSDGTTNIDLQQLKFAHAEVQLQAEITTNDWQGTATAQAADLNALLALLQQAGIKLDLSGSGRLDATLQAQGQQGQAHTVAWQINTSQVSLTNSAGTLASDQLAVTTQGQATAQQNGWLIDASINSNSGQAYAEPVFVDAGKQPVALNLQAQWDGQNSIQVRQLTLQQQDVIAASATGRLQLDTENPAPELAIHINQLHFPGAFITYLQPFLLDTALKNLLSSGSINGSILINDSWPTQVDLHLTDLHADTGNQQFALDKINANLHWRNELIGDNKPPRSTFSWHSGTLLGLQLGRSDIALELWSNTLRFADPARIPIFNGALAIDALRIRKLGTPQMAFLLDAEIEPINVAQISKAFGWPEFGGELSGKITKLRMEDDVVSLGSTLGAQIFGGEVSINDMRLEGALSDWPRFSANIMLDHLDMQQVTQAFSFGRITGQLSGEIKQLDLFNWQAESFDARFYTPADDRSKHRISQRAVQNIGSVAGSGGGITAALQSGFLRFFEDFNYDKLGLSCKLANGVCLMNGVSPAKGNSYYLVKGKGVPRIDVIGNNTRVDWRRLMTQLEAVTESAGPVVQ